MRTHFRLFVLMPLLVLALIAPKVSGLLMHLHPNITVSVICTGSEMVTVYFNDHLEPIEVTESDHQPCALDNPETHANQRLASWVAAPRSYRFDFSETSYALADQARLDRLPDLRGPPVSL